MSDFSFGRGQVWESKATGAQCTLLYVKNGCHWYEIPEWRGPQSCDSTIFLATMQRVQTA